MNKLSCLPLPEPPTVTLQLNCQSSCCKSRMTRAKKDEADNIEDTSSNKNEKDEGEDVICCCFKFKRHAKSPNDRSQVREDECDTEKDIL